MRGHQVRSMSMLQKIVEVQFRKGSHVMSYKESFIGESFTAVDLLQSSFIKSGRLTSLLQPVTGYRGISTLRRDKITASLLGVPAPKQTFWRDIFFNVESVD